jgi:putative ABC transport system permease protein
VKTIDILRLSFGNLRRNMLRTVLTISGVVVGIGAIVFLVSLGFGLQELAVGKVANLDALTQLSVNPGQKEGTTLNKDSIDKFSKIPNVIAVSPLLSYPASISTGTDYGDTIAYGVTPKYFKLEDITTDYGSKTFSGDDANEVIVSIASLKAVKLTDPTKALGQVADFKIVKVSEGNKKQENTVKLKIVGISKDDATKFAYMPLNVLNKFDNSTFNSVKIKTAKREDMAEVRKAIESMGFPTTSVKDTVDQINQIFTWVKIVLGGFGFIALMVAAIGIFNTLTIALLERTHEIGIMKAIGGRNSDVALVFTAEASMIGLFGGLIGVAVGWLIGFVINLLVNFVATSVGGAANSLFYTPAWFAGAVIAFAFTVSTVAGIMPARRAARLDPLEALRYE